MKVADQSAHTSRRITFAVCLALFGALAWTFGAGAIQSPRERIANVNRLVARFPDKLEFEPNHFEFSVIKARLMESRAEKPRRI